MLTHPNIDPIIVQIGPFALRWYGLMYILGIGLGTKLVTPYLKEKFNFKSEDILNLISALVVGVIIGGRLGYILFYDLGYYLSNPANILAVWKGGMSYHGGALGCLVACVLYARSHKINLLSLLDLLGIGSTIGLGLGRIGNFINGELYGRVTSVPWGMVFPYGGPFPRHPSQLYQAFLEGIVLLSFLYWLLRKKTLPPGALFFWYLIGYGSLRILVEFFREPDAQIGLFFNAISMGQILCFLMVILGIAGLFKLNKPNTPTPQA